MDQPTETLSHVDSDVAQRDTRPGPQLFLMLQCEHPSEPARQLALTGVDRVSLGRGKAVTLAATMAHGRRQLDVRVPDRWASTAHVELRARPEGWALEDLASKNGTLVNGRRVQRCWLGDGDLIEVGHTLFCFRSQAEVAPAPEDGSPRQTFSLPFARELAALRALAASPVSVLIQGETGTGKELIARATHAGSGRRGAFVAVNTAALPATLLEAELFGYRKGAFSGAATDHPGLIRASHGGTLFLDEIGDMSAPAQAALLRVLQEREVTPIGELRAVAVDLRVVAATHHDLPALVAAGRFRADLHARLAGRILRLPPLRERREDLGLLIGPLLERGAPRGTSPTLAPAVARALLRHSWPHNIRELEKCLETAAVLAAGGELQLEHLPEAVRAAATEAPPAAAAPRPRVARVLTAEDRQRRAQLVDLLRQHAGNITAVAAAMAKARVQIRRWIDRYAIEASEYTG